MNAFKMSSAQMMTFVKQYQREEVLWNSNLPVYKDRAARKKALKRMVIAINIFGFGIKEVSQKIKNLRSTYFQEVRKIERSKLNGSPYVYKPRVPWFEIVEGCMNKCKNDRLQCLEGTSPIVKTEPMEPEHWEPDHYVAESMPTENEDYLHGGMATNGLLEMQTVRIGPSNNVPSIKQDTRLNQMKPETPQNEFDSFGCYIASALKSLPYENAISAQTGIMLALAEEKRKAMYQDNFTIPHVAEQFKEQTEQS